MKARWGWVGVVAMGVCIQAAAAVPLALQWSALTNEDYWPSLTGVPGGGVYLASTDGSNAYVTKYSQSGAQSWRINAGTSTRTHLIKTDDAGNVYLGGQTYTSLNGPSFGNGDTYLSKYTPGGTKLWGVQVGTDMSDKPIGIVVRPGGESLVLNDPWAINYAVAAPTLQTELYRFSSAGVQTARKQIVPQTGTYPGNTASGSDTLVESPSGNFYAAFSHYGRVNNTIYMYNYLAKLDSAGNTQWVKPLADGSNIMEMDVDAHGELYIATGKLRKYNANGDLLWSSPDGAPYSFQTVCVSDDGRVFAAGTGPIVEFSPSGDVLSTTPFPQQVLAAGQSASIQSIAISNNHLYLGAQIVTGSYWTNNLVMSLGAIPEPSSATLLLAGVVVRRRR